MKKYSYSLVPVTFKDTQELMWGINEIGECGDRIVCELYRHEDSPIEGVDTIDFLVETKFK